MNPIELPMAPAGPPIAPAPEHESLPARGTRRFRVEGMDCGACAKTVESAVAALPGVQTAEVSFGNGSMAVAGEASDEAITGAVARAGYRAHPAVRRTTTDTTPFWRRDARALSTTLSVGLLALAVDRFAGLRAARRRRAAVPALHGRRRLANRPRRCARPRPQAP